MLQTLEALPVGGLEGLDVLADDGLPDVGISRPVPVRDAGAGAPAPTSGSGAADAADARQVAMPASTADGPPLAALILVVGLVGLAAIVLGVRRRRDADPG